MNAERCVLCGKVIPEGSQVCKICKWRVYENSCPTGFLTIMDVRKLTRLRGDQLHRLFDDYGVVINERRFIKFSVFDALRRSGNIDKYSEYSIVQSCRIRE